MAGFSTSLSRKTIFKGRLLNVFVEKIKFPNGHIGELETVKHPGAVLIVPILSEDKIILIRQYRPVISSYIWELPAGTLGRKETPLVCAKRELAEETGYIALRLKRIGHIYPAPGYTTEKIIIYIATGLKKVSQDIQEDEIIVKKIFSLTHVKRLLKTGKIIDAKTICALTLAGLL